MQLMGRKKEVKRIKKIYYQILCKLWFFETIFGSNTIDVKPTGSVEMDLGVRYTKQDNPAFSPEIERKLLLILTKESA
jgi:cell surface protein SprA